MPYQEAYINNTKGKTRNTPAGFKNLAQKNE